MMDSPNVNKDTGIRYGVISANNCEDLFEEIVNEGDNLSYGAWTRELKAKVEEALRGVIEDYAPWHRINDIISSRSEEIVDTLLEAGLSDQFECDEQEYEYEGRDKDGKVKYLLSYLGGAPLIWVIESPWVVTCRGCSPCVPGAGDLDTPDPDGDIAYCIPPEDWPEDREVKPRLLKEVLEDETKEIGDE